MIVNTEAQREMADSNGAASVPNVVHPLVVHTPRRGIAASKCLATRTWDRKGPLCEAGEGLTHEIPASGT